MNKKEKVLSVISGIGIASLILMMAAASGPNSVKYNESTTNQVAQFPATLSSSASFMNPVGKAGGTDGTVYQGGGVFGFNNSILIWTNGAYGTTNPITANTLNPALGYQLTNCSADPTFSGIAGVSNGLAFSDVVVILANGGNRTLTAPANVHVYPPGALVATNGSFAIFSLGGVGGTYTGAVFLAFP